MRWPSCRLLAGLLAVLLLAGCAAVPLKSPDTLPDYALSVVTDDDWTLTLFRRGPHGDHPHADPVLLVPSVGMNRQAFTSAGSDLVDFLAEQGFDVWILETRGSVSSRGPNSGVWQASDWTTEDLLDRDVPAAVDAILSRTGRGSLWWIGHGFGAQLGARYSERQPDKLLGLVGLGLAGDCSFPTQFQRGLGHPLGLVPGSRKIPLRSLGRAVAQALHLAPDTNALHALFNESNVGVEVVAALAATGLEDIGASVMDDLARWCRPGAEAASLLADDFSGATTPLLLLSGRVDPLAPPWAGRAAWRSWGASDKDFVILGEGWGQAYDYGHLDLVLGDGLREEVFPLIGDWMSARRASGPGAEGVDSRQGAGASEAGAEP
jgi:pimeloyl-ACP methyl ester carboxylesterase